jgi:hypothetical protein
MQIHSPPPAAPATACTPAWSIRRRCPGLMRRWSKGQAASRFTGKAGQVFEGFVGRAARSCGWRWRASAKPTAADAALPIANARGGADGASIWLWRDHAGARSGRQRALGGRGAAVLLGLRLRAGGMTSLSHQAAEEQKPSLDHHVTGAPEGTEPHGSVRRRWPRGGVHPRAGDRTGQRHLPRQLRRAPASKRLAGTGAEITVLDEDEMARSAWARCWAWRRVGARIQAAGDQAGTAARRRQAHGVRRQGRDLRHRRHLAEAGRRHGRHEVGHGRRRRRGRRDAGARAAARPRPMSSACAGWWRTCPTAMPSAPATWSPPCRARRSK